MERLTTVGFHHGVMVTRDLGRALGFYRDLLGMRVYAEPHGGDGPREAVVGVGEATSSGALLVLEEAPDAAQGHPGIGGVHHIALGVDTEDSLLRWKRWLMDRGVPVSGPYDRGYFTSLYFRDPDGQVLELATAGPGYAVDEPADALGREVVYPPDRIVRGHRDERAIAALTHPEPVREIGPEMRLDGIHHVSGITDDLDRAGEFLEGVLGLALVKKTTNRDAPDMLHYFWARYDGSEVAPGTSYTLFLFPPHWKRALAGAGQTSLVAFRAGTEANLRAWRDHLVTHDVDVSPVEDRGAWKMIRFRAPDGQAFALATDPEF